MNARVWAEMNATIRQKKKNTQKLIKREKNMAKREGSTHRCKKKKTLDVKRSKYLGWQSTWWFCDTDNQVCFFFRPRSIHTEKKKKETNKQKKKKNKDRCV